MQYRVLGDSGIDASVVGFGAWAIGGWMWGGSDEAAAVRALRAALDHGINLIDTAPIYGFGHSETLVGKAISDRRDQVVLATKCGLVWHVEQGDHFFDSNELGPTQGGDRRIFRCLRPETIRYEIEQSLRRLRTDRIDLYQTHWQESTTPIEDSMATLLALRDQGKIRAIGCSNATPEQMDAYRAAGLLASDQERYSMLDRKQDQDNLPYCQRHGLAFLAYSPLEQGLLTGKIRADRVFAPGDQRGRKPRFAADNLQRVDRLLQAFQPVADELGIGLTALAIAWTVAQPGCTHALVGARTPDQVAENARGGDVELSAAHRAKLDEALNQFGGEIV